MRNRHRGDLAVQHLEGNHMAEEEIRKEGTQEIQTTGEGTSTGAEHSKTVTMTPEEILRCTKGVLL